MIRVSRLPPSQLSGLYSGHTLCQCPCRSQNTSHGRGPEVGERRFKHDPFQALQCKPADVLGKREAELTEVTREIPWCTDAARSVIDGLGILETWHKIQIAVAQWPSGSRKPGQSGFKPCHSLPNVAVVVGRCVCEIYWT